MDVSAVYIQFVSRGCHSLGVHSMHRHRVNNSGSLKINLESSGHNLLKQRLAGEPISVTKRQLQNVNTGHLTFERPRCGCVMCAEKAVSGALLAILRQH